MEFRFVLSEKEAQKILDTLSKEPYIDVVELINNIQRQAKEQMEDDE